MACHNIELNEAVLRKDKILSALIKSISILLSGVDFKKSMNAALAILGMSIDADRVYIFEQFEEENVIYLSQRFEWCAVGVEPHLDVPEYQHLPIVNEGLEAWYTELLAGRAITGHVTEFPPNDLLSYRDTKSLALQPIFLGNQLWGFIGFDHCRKEYNWSSAEKNVLLSVAQTIGLVLNQLKVTAAIHLSEEKYRNIFEASLNAIIIVDSTTHDIVDVNQASLELFGYTKDEMLTKNTGDIVKRVENIKLRTTEVLETGSIHLPEAPCYTKAGDIIICELSVTSFLANSKIYFCGILRDITKEKKLEDEIEQQRKQLKAALEKEALSFGNEIRKMAQDSTSHLAASSKMLKDAKGGGSI